MAPTFWSARQVGMTLLILASTCLSAGAADVKLTTVWTAKTVNDPARIKYAEPGGEVRALRLYAGTPRADHPKLPPKPLPLGPVFVSTGPAVQDGDFWVMTAQEPGKNPESVKFILLTEPSHPGARPGANNVVNDLIFVPLKQPKKGVVYRIAPAKGRSIQGILVAPHKVSNEDDFLKNDVSNTFEDADISYIDGNKALEPSVSLKSGKDSTATLKLFYGQQVWKGENKVRFQSMLEVDGTYRPKNKKDYVTKIDGEIDFLYLMTDVPPGGQFFHALWETGLNARIESDQSFANANETFGWTNYLAFNGDGLQALANALCLNGDLGGNAPSALLSLSYELVQSIKEDAATKRRQTDRTTDRVRAHLYWSATILKELKIARLWNDTSLYDVSLVIDSGASYDFRVSKFTPDVNLSLELGPTTLDKSKPSFTLTYVNGKTSSRFENYNALLGGIKLPF